MIESEIVMLSLDSIQVGSERRTLEIPAVEEIAFSVSQRGLIHTILIDKSTNILCAGAHRLAAFKFNRDNKVLCIHPEYKDWTQIPSRFCFDVSPEELVALELEENLRRNELSWNDAAISVQRFHGIKQGNNPDWTLEDTGNVLGMLKSQVSRYIMIAKELEKGNKKLDKASSIRSAYEIFSRDNDRAVAKEMSLLDDIVAPPVIGFQESILQEDYLKWIETYTGPKFNFLHCDFPYGINFQKSAQGHAAEWTEYQDTPEIFWALVDSTIKNMDKILQPSAHIMFWFSMNFYNEVRKKFEAVPGLSVNPFPLMWYKTDKGIVPDAQRGPRRCYETAFMMARGDRKIVKISNNVYAAPVSKSLHVSEKPESMLRYFFSMFVDEFTEILDPTCGSGTAIRAAESYKADKVLGLEINKDNVEAARFELTRSRQMRQLSIEAKT